LNNPCLDTYGIVLAVPRPSLASELVKVESSSKTLRA
jgi:hypothetical protein